MSDTTSSCCGSCRCGGKFWVFILGLLAFVLFAVLTLFVKRSVGSSDAFEAKRAADRIAAREKIEKESHDLLTTSAWADQAKGTVRIPLEDAMALEITALKQKTPRAAYAVGTAGPVPTSGPAAAPAQPAKAPTAAPTTPSTSQPVPKK